MSPETVTTRFTHGGAGGGVEHGAAHGGGQAPRGNLTAGDGLNQLLFRALGVPGFQKLEPDANSGGVVAPVFQLGQTIQKDRSGLPVTGVTNNSTHNTVTSRNQSDPAWAQVAVTAGMCIIQLFGCKNQLLFRFFYTACEKGASQAVYG